MGNLKWLMIFAMIACSHQKELKQLATSNQCEEAIKHLPGVRKDTRVERRGEQVLGHLVSYPAIATGYITDAVVIIGGSIGLSVVICSPLMILEGAASRGYVGNISTHCMGNVMGNLDFNPKLGQSIYKKTKNIRCADFSPLSRGIRRVASCYKDRKDENSLLQSKKYLESIVNNFDLYGCLDIKEQKKVDSDYSKIQESLLNLL
jgi:hypothetical protein